MIKILQLPTTWGEQAQHWLWTAEMINRHCDKNKFIMRVMTDLDEAEKVYSDYDLIVPWYITRIPPAVPRDKYVIVSHSRFETGCLSWPESAGRGVVSQYLYDYIHKQEQGKNKIHVVNYGIDTEFWKPLQKPKSDKVRVGWVGEPSVKELDIAREAVDQTDFEFIPLDLSNRANFRSLYGMPNYYNEIDVLLVSSLEEGFHRPSLEAASSGLAVIATDVGINRELLGDEAVVSVEGYEFHQLHNDPSPVPEIKRTVARNLAKKLNALTPSKIKTMGARNRQEVCTNWTWEKKIGAWEKMFEEAYEATGS